MTAKELIKILTAMPSDAKVYLWDGIYTDEFVVKFDSDGDVVIER